MGAFVIISVLPLQLKSYHAVHNYTNNSTTYVLLERIGLNPTKPRTLLIFLRVEYKELSKPTTPA